MFFVYAPFCEDARDERWTRKEKNNSSSKSSGTISKSEQLYLLHGSRSSTEISSWGSNFLLELFTKREKGRQQQIRHKRSEGMKGTQASGENNSTFIICVFAHVNYRNKIIKREVTVGVFEGFSASFLVPLFLVYCHIVRRIRRARSPGRNLPAMERMIMMRCDGEVLGKRPTNWLSYTSVEGFAVSSRRSWKNIHILPFLDNEARERL